MIQRNIIFLVLLSVFSASLWQRHVVICAAGSSQPIESKGHFLSVHALDFVTTEEQRQGFTPLKVAGKPIFKTRLFSWLNNPTEYRRGSVAVVRYFSTSKTRTASLEPPDIVFPFHGFW